MHSIPFLSHVIKCLDALQSALEDVQLSFFTQNQIRCVPAREDLF